jgi:pimeloyl-ACP methyl ester carboxylesterase
MLYGRGGIVSLAGGDRLRVGLGEIEVLRCGRGRPILLIHGVNPVSPQATFLDGLAEHGEIVAPSAPGFGNSPRPPDFDTMYDLVHLYREVLDGLPGQARLIGFSFGGWIAAEIAAAGSAKIDRLVLVDPVGIKIGGREERDIVHFFNTSPEELNRRSWHDPARRPPGCWGLGWQAVIDETMSDDDMVLLARNWDALCLYAWRPHMYNPQLKQWLRRVSVPTLVLWGASDRIATPEYGRTYARLIPGARFELIECAGHHPELEQPRAFVKAVADFLGAEPRGVGSA